MQIRAAMRADADCVQEIFSACLARADWLPVVKRTGVDFSIVSTGELIYVATRPGGAVVGFISVQPVDAFVHHMFVHPDVQGSGVGQLLLRSLVDWLPTPWRLKCVAINHRALAFYRELGWYQVATGESADGVYLVLEWDPSRKNEIATAV